MAIIEIEGMEFYAYHGHFEVEKVAGNRFLVDLRIETERSRACQTDSLDDTLDYQKAYSIVKDEMETPSNLLENVAQRIINHIRIEFDEVLTVKVKVSKMNPPMGGQIEKVSVTIID